VSIVPDRMSAPPPTPSVARPGSSSGFDAAESEDMLGSTGASVGMSSSALRPTSPRIGTAGGLDVLDLDELDYAVPKDELSGGKWWVQQPCAWAREPRVKQFLRPKFCAIPLTLTLSACFLALAITIMTVPKIDDADDSPSSTAPLDCSPVLWQPGAVLIRDPLHLSQLMLLPLLPGLVNYTSVSVPLLSYFALNEWDMLAEFNGTHLTFFGPRRLIADTDTGVGALGDRDRPEGFNSWAAQPAVDGAWRKMTDEWYGTYQSIRIFSTAAAGNGGSAASSSSSSSSSTGNAGNANSSTGSARRLLSSTRSLLQSSADGAVVVSDVSSDPLIEAASSVSPHGLGRVIPFYLFNNRTDVHTGAYGLKSAVTPTSPSGAGGISSSSSSSSTGAADPSSAVYPPHPEYNPLPTYRLRLFISHEPSPSLLMCGERFVQPADSSSSSSSSTGATSGG